MKKLILFTIFTIHYSLFTCLSQVNLVPNPSFETHTRCSGIYEFFNLGSTQNCVPPWFNPTQGSPDYFNSCYNTWTNKTPSNIFGYQLPKTGTAYAGILVFCYRSNLHNFREYLELRLTDSLIDGNDYCVNFYVSMTPYLNGNYTSSYSISEIGLYFSDTAITLPNISSNYTPLPVIPHVVSPIGVQLNDTLNWMQISGTYTAHGGEKYITIGNFKDDANTDTAFIEKNNFNGYLNAYYFIDDVSVTDCTGQGVKEESEENKVNISPNPTTTQFTITTSEQKINQIKIYNIIGESVWETPSPSGRAGVGSNTTTIDITNQPSGIYFIQITTTKGITSRKLIKQ